MKRSMLAAVVLLLAGCPAVVLPDPGVAQVGGTCDQDIPCASGLSCVDGHCAFPDAGVGTSSSSSSSGGDSSSMEGRDGGGPACRVRLNCAVEGSLDGRDCVDGECVWIACQDDSVCGALGCVEGVCGPVTTCGSDAECPGGICENNRCTQGCQDDATCNAGQQLPVFTCDTGRCRQRCFGDATCVLTGGNCINNVCVPPECMQDMDCSGGSQECVTGRCQPFEPCSSDAQCTADGAFCDPMGRCRQHPPCTRDVDCGMDEVCQAGRCLPAPGCGAMSMCEPGTECVDNHCVPALGCRGNADCATGEICRAGTCAMPPMATVARIAITTSQGMCDPLLDARSVCDVTLRPGDVLALNAVALDAAGRILAGVPVGWLSSDDMVAQVEAGPGITSVLDVGMTQGTARITAKKGSITSPALRVHNLGVAPTGVRVTVVHGGTGEPVQGAVVVLNSSQANSDADGVVVIDPAMLTPPYTLSVFHADFDYVTVAGIQAAAMEDLDLVVPVMPASALTGTAGLRGHVNLDQVSSSGPVAISLSGVSAPSVQGLGFATLLGETFQTQLNLPVIGAQGIPLPGGITLSADIPVLGTQEVKSSFDVLGTGGRRIGWTFGGRVPLTAVTGLVGLGNPAGAIFALIPFFEGLTHGIHTGLLLSDLPLVRDGDTDFDGEPDVNGNGNEDEQVPDYLAFPQVDIAARQEQVLRTSVAFGNLPQGAANGQALIVAGARVPGHGFVPLGLASVRGRSATGQSMKLAPRYGGLEAGDYAVAVFAFGGGGNGTPQQVSIRTVHADVLPANADVGSLMPFPGAGSFRRNSRTVSLIGVDAADLHRATLSGEGGAWRVYLPGGGDAVNVALPAIPMGMPNRGQDGVALEAVQVSSVLKAATVEAQLRSLISGGPGLQSLAQETEGLSRGALTAQ